MSKKVDLNSILKKYVETGDQSLITEDVYTDLLKFCKYISKKYTINYPKYADDDELMLVCNEIIWKKIDKFDPTRCENIMTFLYIVIDNGIKMDIRNEKKKVDTIYFSETIGLNNDDGSELTIEEILYDNKSTMDLSYCINESIIKDSLNNTLINAIR